MLEQLKALNLKRQQPTIARKLKKVVGEIKSLNHITLNDKLIIQGIVHKQVFFVGIDDKVHHISGNIPFSAILDIPGIAPGMNVNIFADLESIEAKLAPSGEQVFCKAIVKITAIAEDVSYIFLVAGTDKSVIAETVIKENSEQVLVEDILVLDRSIQKVEECRATVTINNADVLDNKVLIQAILHNQIFYIGKDDISHHQSFDIPVSCFVEVEGALPEMNVYAEPVIEMNTADVISLNELKLKAIIRYNVTVTQEITVGIAVAQDGQEYVINGLIGESTSFQHMVESVEILEHEAIKIRDIKVNLRNISSLVVMDKVIIQGIIHKQIYYVGTDNVNYHQSADIPFTAFTDYPGARPGLNAVIVPVVEYTKYELTGSRKLTEYNIIRFDVTIVEKDILPVVQGTAQDLRVRLPLILGETSAQVMVHDIEPIEIIENIIVTKDPIIVCTESMASKQTLVSNTIDVYPPAVSIGKYKCIIESTTTSILENEIIVSGYFKCCISYVDSESLIHKIEKQKHFAVLVPLEGILPSDIIEVKAEVEHVDLSILPGGNQIRILVTIRATVRGFKKEIVYVVTDVTGPDITTNKILILAELPTHEIKQMYVVTEVYDTDLVIVKRTFMLNVVDEGFKPVDVVVDVIVDM